MWPKHLARNEIFPFSILPYSQQEYYWPDKTHGPYNYPLQPIGTEKSMFSVPFSKRIPVGQMSPDGTPEFPYAATGPMQYARNFQYQFNSTYNATLVESCTSVFVIPTRGTKLDGRAGRASKDIMIAVPRRQAPGWDGCRNGPDGSPGLQYYQPTSRYGHKAVFVKEFNEFYVYGGMAYYGQQLPSINNT